MRTINPKDYDLPYQSIFEGYYSAQYFNRGADIVEKYGVGQQVTMQVFQKRDAILAGIDEALAVIINNTCEFWEDLVVHALPEGSEIAPWETVMTIEGDLKYFMHLESVYLGILCDATTVATNMNALVKAANGKPVLYLADRFNGMENQERQGAAATLGGASGICTPAGNARTGGQAIGTMPHALIAAFGGDVVEASRAFLETFPEVPLISLVDFNNDCVTDALRCAEAFGDKLYAVRLDTSEKMIDKSLTDFFCGTPFGTNGVNPFLVHNVRDALDQKGYEHVKIAVSGGFNVEKIGRFEDFSVPADIYGVGSSVLKGGGDFTADIVKPVSKKGREFRPNERMELIK